MEAVQLFQIYRLCNLKASRITVRRIMMTSVYFYVAHSGFDWIQKEAMVFFLTKSCSSPRRFVFCYQGTWLILEHFVGRVMGCTMGNEETFFIIIKCNRVPWQNCMEIFLFGEYSPCSSLSFETQTNTQTSCSLHLSPHLKTSVT